MSLLIKIYFRAKIDTENTVYFFDFVSFPVTTTYCIYQVPHKYG